MGAAPTCQGIISSPSTKLGFPWLWVFPQSHILAFIFTCPIAIAYSMGQIIKSVCVCQCVYLSVCGHFHVRISWSIFTKIGTDVRTPKRKNEFVRGSISYHPFPYFVPNPHFRSRGPENPMWVTNKKTALQGWRLAPLHVKPAAGAMNSDAPASHANNASQSLLLLTSH